MGIKAPAQLFNVRHVEVVDREYLREPKVVVETREVVVRDEKEVARLTRELAQAEQLIGIYKSQRSSLGSSPQMLAPVQLVVTPVAMPQSFKRTKSLLAKIRMLLVAAQQFLVRWL